MAGLEAHSPLRVTAELCGTGPDAFRHLVALRPARAAGRAGCVLFAPDAVATLRLRVEGALRAPDAVRIERLAAIGGARASLALARAAPARFARLPAAALRGPAAARDALRAAQAVAVGSAPDKLGHDEWYRLFGSWSSAGIASSWPAAVAAAPTLALLVLAPAGAGRAAAIAATRRGIARQTVPVAGRVLAPGEDWRRAIEAPPLDGADYVGLLQAGEVPVAHAAELARLLLARAGEPALATSDHDRLDRNGRRADPCFQPAPNHALMLSGTLARGLWLVRRDALAAAARAPDMAAAAVGGGGADALRLALWLHRRREGTADGIRLPFILAGRRDDAPGVDPEALAAIVRDHLARAGLPWTVRTGSPLRLDPDPGADPGPVTAIVPSTLRAPHAEGCIGAVLRGTDAAAFEMVVAVSQPGPLDAAQRAIAARLEGAHPNLRVRHLEAERFNFAATVNAVARTVAPERALLLLNDDVSPLGRDWLVRMGAHLADPRVGAVGAKLLYPSGAVQHGGIVMGLAGLCEHAFRHAPGEAPGYAGRAVLPQRLLAATGACLLVRAGAMRAVGGMDEIYPSAFNDVDLCLRIDEAGFEVVQAADAALTHRELLTYGAHHAGERAAFLDAEVARMRARWAAAIADDRYYSPNLDLRPERGFEPAWPPRLDPARIARRPTPT